MTCIAGQKKIVELLLEKGAEVNVAVEDIVNFIQRLIKFLLEERDYYYYYSVECTTWYCLCEKA